MTQRHAVALFGALGLTLVATDASAKEFTAPAGQLGGALETGRAERFRAYGDLAFFTRSQSGASITHLGTDLGFGFKASDDLELQLDVPVGAAFFNGSNQFALGNLAVSLNWFSERKSYLWKLGGGISAGPWLNFDTAPVVVDTVGFGLGTRSFESPWLWDPQTANIFVPGRLEIGEKLRFTVDGSLNIAIPTAHSGETSLYWQLAPGVSYRATRVFTLGARVLGTFYSGSSTDGQIALEPFVRADIDKTFVAARFTMPLDEPLGFAFDTGGVWGLQAAVATRF